MSALKKLAGQTAIYGLPSIVGRFLNYLLVPLHTEIFGPAKYGVVTELFAYVAFLVVVLTYGMETAFFRFSNHTEEDKSKVFSTALSALFSTSLLFFLVCLTFSSQIATAINYEAHHEYIVWFGAVLSLDAVSSILLANLRQLNRPVWFASVNIASIALNIGVNVFFLWVCPKVESLNHLYNPEIGVGYIFIATLAASGVKLLLLTPALKNLFGAFDFALLKRMLTYAWPLLLVGFSGIINETLDRALLKYLLIPEIGHEQAMYQLGVYGANYKLSIIISLFIQAFRYAAEPFFFKQNGQSKETFAKVMDYFVWVVSGMFLVVMLNIDLFKLFIRQESYWEGLNVVPVLLLANIFLGISYNLSIWYKLSDKTKYGAVLSVAAAVVTVVFNLLLIPKLRYLGAAWATFICYAFLMVASAILGQKHYPVPYRFVKNSLTIAFAVGIYWLTLQLAPNFHPVSNNVGLIIFGAIFFGVEIYGRNRSKNHS